MTSNTITDRFVQEVREGDLVLEANKGRMDGKFSSSLILGVFERIERREIYHGKNGHGGFRRHVYLSEACRLRPLTALAEVNLFNQIELLKSPSSDWHGSFELSAGRIQILEFGQERIVEVLRNLKGYEAYAQWISKLQKPYLR